MGALSRVGDSPPAEPFGGRSVGRAGQRATTCSSAVGQSQPASGCKCILSPIVHGSGNVPRQYKTKLGDLFGLRSQMKK